MVWFVMFILAVIAVVIWLACRPTTIYDGNSAGWFVIRNELTGNFCMGGKRFRTRKAAMKSLRRMLHAYDFGEYEMYTVRRVV